MHQRGVLFTSTIGLLALLLSLPGIALLLNWCYFFLTFGVIPEQFLGFTPTTEESSPFVGATVSRNRIYWIDFSELDWETDWNVFVRSADPEFACGWIGLQTGDLVHTIQLQPVDDTFSGFSFELAGDKNQLWMVDLDHLENVFQLDTPQFVEPVNAKLETTPKRANYYEIPMSVTTSTTSGDALPFHSTFLKDGKPTVTIKRANGEIELLQWADDAWHSLGEIASLDTSRAWTTPDGQTLFEPQSTVQVYETDSDSGTRASPSFVSFAGRGLPIYRQACGTVRLIQQGSNCHLFWQVADRLLYRNGLELRPTLDSEADPAESRAPANEEISESASAVDPENGVKISSDWTLIAKLPEGTWAPVLVGGEPAILRISNTDLLEGDAVATIIRKEENAWNEGRSYYLPFGTNSSSVVWREDGSVSYLCVTSKLGQTKVLAIEPEGIRLTPFQHAQIPDAISGYLAILIMLIWSLFAGMILAVIATLMMWRDQAKYEFGVSTVQLASILERGVARAVDLVLLSGVAIGLFVGLAFVTRLDVETVLEALNLNRFDHPSVKAFERIAMSCIACLVIGMLVLIALQGRFAVTPGKWLCGIRTVRTTLRPCGFARSLLREILLCVDSLNLISWAPGILFIAFTNFRQRFGDLAADTIVIRVRRSAVRGNPALIK